MNSIVPIAKNDQPLFAAWHEGFRAADTMIVSNPYAQTKHNPRLAANFTEGFNAGRRVAKKLLAMREKL